jgi:hypothetical protein
LVRFGLSATAYDRFTLTVPEAIQCVDSIGALDSAAHVLSHDDPSSPNHGDANESAVRWHGVA